MVDVTDVDRSVAQEFALICRLTGTQLHNLAGLLASHRIAGERAGLEKAARVVKTYWVEADYDTVGIADADMAMALCEQAATAIRNLVPGDSK